ncbi:DUF2911 domain-containing protein [Longitalea arenae]|uniref:DUF2911 domain-containing protein n=1 Tax=Longitalea arenae TaxID=2812558 RepID=UPI0019674220|nr:DUF2911 domain-containing protein [Longitalea arenae]
MRKTILIGCLIAFAFITEAQLKTPAPSSTQTIKQDFGLGSIELAYSRPNIKGRKVFGDLVPFGKVWRTGANQATTLTFADEVTIGGKKIPAGKYGLLTIPDKGSWTIIITKQLDVTSPAAYKQENDVVRIQAKPESIKNKVETFTMQFANVKPTSIELHMMWDQTNVVLPITTEIDAKVMAQIDELMKKEDPKNHPYFGAAMYYMETGKDLNKALDWFNKAAEANPKAFWVMHQKANCLAKLGKKQEAIESANKSMELAKEAKNDDYVALNQKLLATLK